MLQRPQHRPWALRVLKAANGLDILASIAKQSPQLVPARPRSNSLESLETLSDLAAAREVSLASSDASTFDLGESHVDHDAVSLLTDFRSRAVNSEELSSPTLKPIVSRARTVVPLAVKAPPRLVLETTTGPRPAPPASTATAAEFLQPAEFKLYFKRGRVGIYTANERERIIRRYLEKRGRRNWKKKVRYNCRKNLADQRVRVKGRFVSAKTAKKPAAPPAADAAPA